MSKPRSPAPSAPVARVLPLLGLAHLDRPFDYLVDEDQHEGCRPGVRVRVRFAGRLVDAVVLSRTSVSDHTGNLAWLERVISPEVVYPAQTRALVEALCDRYGGIRSDLIRSAVPARHATAENSDISTPWDELGTVTDPDLSPWISYLHGPNFVDAVLAGRAVRAAWQIAPGDDWARAVAGLAVATAQTGGGVLVALPDQRDVDALGEALRELVSARQVTVLNSALGPQARYRRFLSILHGQGRLVIGTRSAAYAPVRDLRLVVLLNDGDDNLVDPRAPYTHAREVLTTRSAQCGCALIIGGHTRTAEVQLMVEQGWMHGLVAPREVLRQRMPRVRATADSDTALERDPLARSARLPAVAFDAVRRALARDEPVLIQTPRKGYVPTLACGRCRVPARCRSCNGPLGLPSTGDDTPGVPTCRWCGRPAAGHRCGTCGSVRLRAVVLGSERTAEELGRAFPKTPVSTSGGSRVLDAVPPGARLVVSTPGAEPAVTGGAYGACLLLDTWALLGRADLRATEDTLAKWMAAASLVSSNDRGGEVIVVADPALPVVQALIRWDTTTAAAAELAERREVDLPPAVHMAAVDGPQSTLDDFLGLVDLPPGADVLGPVDLPPGSALPGDYDESRFGPPQRMLIRVPLGAGPRSALGRALRAARTARAVRKDELPLRIQIDPLHLG
ncbi:primosomal protein N' [Corynebacterium sp. P7003]|uniref:Probable replication restart protein PriA n=1 Tax=Corynebacterium pygosceleis TaxID=2800406 RepID=A0ABT3WRB3_9CORY|nr:primosomal protein N' [Corynebacterium pygosceleis]MCX7443795.1 primosomal protein N' [Corynebacterium pygosceleis]